MVSIVVRHILGRAMDGMLCMCLKGIYARSICVKCLVKCIYICRKNLIMLLLSQIKRALPCMLNY